MNFELYCTFFYLQSQFNKLLCISGRLVCEMWCSSVSHQWYAEASTWSNNSSKKVLGWIEYILDRAKCFEEKSNSVRWQPGKGRRQKGQLRCSQNDSTEQVDEWGDKHNREPTHMGIPPKKQERIPGRIWEPKKVTEERTNDVK